jgi:hypothetical protein
MFGRHAVEWGLSTPSSLEVMGLWADRSFNFQNQIKVFQKLNRTSYVNRKDHLLLLLKNFVQI